MAVSLEIAPIVEASVPIFAESTAPAAFQTETPIPTAQDGDYLTLVNVDDVVKSVTNALKSKKILEEEPVVELVAVEVAEDVVEQFIEEEVFADDLAIEKAIEADISMLTAVSQLAEEVIEKVVTQSVADAYDRVFFQE